MARFERGERFLTSRTEGDLRYEIAFALDGRGSTSAARDEYRRAVEVGGTDTYVEADGTFEVARLSLKLWLDKPSLDTLNELDRAIAGFRAWNERTWSTVTTKMWAHYHLVCAYRQRLLPFLENTEESRVVWQRAAENSAAYFTLEADNLTYLRKYQLYFVVFLLTAQKLEYLPGDPLRCNLGDLISKYRVQ